jgi:adenosylhomocysteine nucleosidase
MAMSEITPAADARRPQIAFLAAMKQEIAPLVRGWTTREFVHDGRRYRLYQDGDRENGGPVLICSGIGAEHGRRATEAVIQETRPAKMISVGFAGALIASLKVADVVEPRLVINAADGARTDTGHGEGSVVSSPAVAGRDQKLRLASAYGAVAVDMEGASVAQGAQAHGIEFAALKAISDPLDFQLPPIDPFVSARGEFRWARFVLHVAVRPWLWARTIALGVNSARASRALSAAIENYLKRESPAAN